MERRGNLMQIGFLLANIFAYWPHVLAQEGYLSLACGRNSGFTDTSTGIRWIPDDNYTSTGIAWSTGRSSTAHSQPETVRYFPEGNKNCYTLDVTKGGKYLIRGTHGYLNLDGTNSLAEFDVAVDATIVYSLKAITNEPQVVEVIVAAQRNKLNYCLLRREGFPVIMTLEIRPLPTPSYPDASRGLLTSVNRVDLVHLRDVRYPFDGVERKTGFADDADKMFRKYSEFTFPFPGNTKGTFVVYLYFAGHLDRRVEGGEKGFDIRANGASIGVYDLFEAHSPFSEYIIVFPVSVNSLKLTVAIEAAESSRELHCLDAFEVYRFVPTAGGTQESDVQALMSIKKRLNITGWSGDPCLPVPWDGVTCEMQAGEVVVTRLDLPNHTLTGGNLGDIRSLIHLKQLLIQSSELSEEIPSRAAEEHKYNLRYSFLGRRLLNQAFTPGSPTSSRSSSNTLLKIFIATAVGVTCLLAFVVITMMFYCYRRRQRRLPALVQGIATDFSNGPNYVMKSPLQDPKHLEMQSIGPQRLTLKEVQTVTQKFKSKIGEGGFGAVYYGSLPNGTSVAVKVRSLNSNQGTREFTTELELLRQIKHENLVPLVGFCTEYEQQILVYPYMSNGSLHDRLYDKSVGRKPLDWLTRLNIILGAARGIHFLHTGGDRCVIHRDIKSSNILLDDSMKAKLADFGLSKVSPREDESLVSTEVRGTAEYLDPEYYQTHQLTEMSDVYSFGIVLLETVCGREPLNMNRPPNERSLVEWVRPYIKDANIDQIVDPEIQTYTPESLWRVVEIALQSVEPHASRRPSVAYIVRELEDALIIENNASQYMASIQSLDSLCIHPNLDSKDFSKKEPMVFPLSLPFEPSPVFSETMSGDPDPR